MKRSNAFVLRWTALQLATFAGVMALMLALVYFLIEPGSEVGSGMIGGILATVGPMLSVMLPMTLITGVFPIALSFGATRRGFFAATQVSKLAAALFLPAGLLALNTFGDTAVPFRLGMSLCTGLAVAGIGELCGTICLRFGQKAMWLFLLLCALCGAMVGLSSSMTINGNPFFADLLCSILSGGWPAAITQLAVYAVCTAGSWAILRHAEA